LGTPNLSFPALICIAARWQQHISASNNSYNSSNVFAPAVCHRNIWQIYALMFWDFLSYLSTALHSYQADIVLDCRSHYNQYTDLGPLDMRFAEQPNWGLLPSLIGSNNRSHRECEMHQSFALFANRYRPIGTETVYLEVVIESIQFLNFIRCERDSACVRFQTLIDQCIYAYPKDMVRVVLHLPGSVLWGNY
jgi:hypothetical protein